MAELTGLISVPDEGPTLRHQPNGSAFISLDGDTTLRFRTLAAYDAWSEELDRQRAALGVQQTLGGDAA